MPRPRIFGYLAVFTAVILAGMFAYSIYAVTEETVSFSGVNLNEINSITFYAVAIPIGLVSLAVIGTGFWIGWTLLTIKVVPPMHDMADKKDFSKIKAFFLCLGTMFLGLLLLYGIYIKNFWALAIPAAAISLVILGAVFWVGIAIITTRSTLPEEKK
jgi:uncharacterized protein with PQ loop repeat